MFSVIPGNSNDADNDGLPDGWELGHGLNPNNAIDAVEDYDHDGIQDGEEAVSGKMGISQIPSLQTVMVMG